MNILNSNKVSFIIILVMVLIGLTYPLISPYDAGNFSFPSLMPPSLDHLLGTDEMGHDISSMLLVGFRVSIGIAIAAAVLSTLIGTALATIAAYYKGLVDRIIVRITEVFILVPEIVVLLFFTAFTKPMVYNSIFAIAFFSWSKITRIIRAKALSAIELEKVQYTLLLKGNILDITLKMWRELYPAVATMFVFQCGKAAVYESTLAFFGIGDPLTKSWGRIIRNALDYEGIFSGNIYCWYLLPPILCILIFVVAISRMAYNVDEIRSEKR